ncbi:TonB-dependent receptor [Kineobactrum salinum]|uniref:TonB-dependent receptor n=1 Tax=Kineobactrum salinum TaxID=2708301 RepID=A0A6C0TZ33_9GAMM|nr:TonB-dependent receptor [Kineobactrum salinum]QIB65082.1 TonB-dependent receptor [Kineobactrum salinum]
MAKGNGRAISAFLSCVTGLGVSGLCVNAVAAQPGATLEEVVVTARRRAESLQSTPVSVTAFTANELAARQISNISQIAEATPNLVFDSSAPISGSKSAASIFIRGIGQTDFALVTDPGVGLYLDGVYIARSVGGVLELADVEQVEVLRGPQGTLFGKNTIGGAINVISRKPGAELGGSVELKLGTDQRRDFKASVDLPLSDTLAVRLAYANLNQDGYVENLGGGPDLGDTDAQLGSLIVDFHPTENFSMIFAADATYRREQAMAQKILDFNPEAGAPTFAPFNGVIAPFLGVQPYDARYLVGGKFATSQGRNELARSDLDVYGVSLTLNYDFEAFSLKSITAQRGFDSQFGRDSDNSPFVIVETFDDMEHDQFSQEFQFSGVALDERLDWLLGAYYFQEDGDNLNLVRTAVLDIQSGGAIDSDSWALFAHSSYDLSDRLRLNVGARYTEETKRFTPDQQVLFNEFTQPLFGGAGFTDGQRILPFQEYSQDFDDFSVTAGLDYHWTDRLMTYISYSEGFKSGGFNQRVFPPREVPGSFDPEQVQVYELGAKWSNSADTIRLESAIFYTDYDDIQVKIIDVVAPGTGNAAAGEVYGGELELGLLLTPALELQFGLGYLDTQYTDFDNDFDPAQGIDEGDSFVNSPEWSLSGSLAYTASVGDLGELTLRGDWSYRDKVYNDAANTEAIAQQALHLFNAGVTYTTAAETWQLALQVRNLSDRSYLITGNNEFNGFGYVEGVYARPREWSLSVKRMF